MSDLFGGSTLGRGTTRYTGGVVYVVFFTPRWPLKGCLMLRATLTYGAEWIGWLLLVLLGCCGDVFYEMT